MIRTAVKLGLAVATVHYSREAGVWGNADDAEKIYARVQHELNPVCKAVKAKVPFEAPALPTSGEVTFITKYYWNEGVKGTFHFIKMIPCYLGQGVKKVSNAVKQALEAPPPAAQKSAAAPKPAAESKK